MPLDEWICLFQPFLQLLLLPQNELCRMKLDVAMLDELVHEYCVYRGIVDAGVAQVPGELYFFCYYMQALLSVLVFFLLKLCSECSSSANP